MGADGPARRGFWARLVDVLMGPSDPAPPAPKAPRAVRKLRRLGDDLDRLAAQHGDPPKETPDGR